MGWLCGLSLVVFGFIFVELFTVGVSFLIEYLLEWKNKRKKEQEEEEEAS